MESVDVLFARCFRHRHPDGWPCYNGLRHDLYRSRDDDVVPALPCSFRNLRALRQWVGIVHRTTEMTPPRHPIVLAALLAASGARAEIACCSSDAKAVEIINNGRPDQKCRIDIINLLDNPHFIIAGCSFYKDKPTIAEIYLH